MDATLNLCNALQEHDGFFSTADHRNGRVQKLLGLRCVVLAEGESVLDGGQVLAFEGLLPVRTNNNRDRDGRMDLME